MQYEVIKGQCYQQWLNLQLKHKAKIMHKSYIILQFCNKNADSGLGWS